MSRAMHRSKHPAASLIIIGLWLLASTLAIAENTDHWPSSSANDAQLAAQLRQLEQAEQSPAARRWLEALLNHPETARKPHPEGRGQTLPHYAIAARAQHLLQRWDEQLALEQLRSDPTLRSKSTTTRAQHRALLTWLSEASEQQLAEFRAQTDAAQWTDDILTLLIRRQDQWSDWLALAQRGEQARSLNLLLQSAPLDHPEFSSLLDTLAANPALRGGVATLRARWITRDPQRMAALLHALDTQTWTVPLIETALKVQPAQFEQRMSQALGSADKAALAAWALWQTGTPTAHAVLRDYAQSDFAIAHLAKEIDAWLR